VPLGERVLITTWSLLERGTICYSNFPNVSWSLLSLNIFGNAATSPRFPKQVTDNCFVGIIIIRSGCRGSEPTAVATMISLSRFEPLYQLSIREDTLIEHT
jgi:hypothetical protein